MVEINFEDVEILDLDPEFFVSWLSGVCEKEGSKLGNLGLIFCSDDYLLKINKEYLNHDYYTDIITFDYTDQHVSGDLFISLDRVKENAESFNCDFREELNRVVVHGVLHLLGYTDKDAESKERMSDKENEMLRLI